MNKVVRLCGLSINVIREIFFTIKSPPEMHKQEDPGTTKRGMQSAQITRVFLILKALHEVHKQQQ